MKQQKEFFNFLEVFLRQFYHDGDTRQKDSWGRHVSEPSFFFFSFPLQPVTPVACGSSQAKGQVGAAAAGLYHGLSNTRSELYLGPTSLLVVTATLDP